MKINIKKTKNIISITAVARKVPFVVKSHKSVHSSFLRCQGNLQCCIMEVRQEHLT